MSKQTAIDWYINKLVEILGDKCNELTIEQTLANHYAIKQAKEMEMGQTIKPHGTKQDYSNGSQRDPKIVTGEQYYNEKYGGNNG